MKWIAGICMTVALLTFTISAYADYWNYEDHDYHIGYCGKLRIKSSPTDTPDCQSYKGDTSYSCCCTTCNDYVEECLDKKGLPKLTCERVKHRCQQDCNDFLSTQSPSPSLKKN